MEIPRYSESSFLVKLICWVSSAESSWGSISASVYNCCLAPLSEVSERRLANISNTMVLNVGKA